MELLKNAAHEAQAVDVQSTVNQTAEGTRWTSLVAPRVF